MEFDPAYRAAILKRRPGAYDRAARALSRRAWIESAPAVIAWLEAEGASAAVDEFRAVTEQISQAEKADLAALRCEAG